MFLNKVVSNSRQILSRKALTLKGVGLGARQRHVQAVPSRTKLSGAEGVGLAVLLFVAMWSIPVWVSYHIPDYQGEERDKYTGR